MTRWRRRAFWIAVGLYAIALPSLLVFAFGISFRGSPQHPLLSTASFQVATTPQGAHVWLQGHGTRLSPAVFDGLEEGDYFFSISADQARTWTGTLHAQAGLAYAPPPLRMIPTAAPHEIFAFAAREKPILVDDGRSVAYVVAGDTAVTVARIQTGSVVVERNDVPPEALGRRWDLTYLPMSGQLLATWFSDGTRFLAAVRGAQGAPATSGSSPVIWAEPDDAIQVLWLSADGKSLVTEERTGILLQEASGASRTLLRFSAPVIASGYVRGRWYFLDTLGHLSQYGSPIGPGEIGRLAVGSDVSSLGFMEILWAQGSGAMCYSPARRSLVRLSARVVQEFPDYDGAWAAEDRDLVWVWRGEVLSSSEQGRPPRKVAILDARVLAVREQFLPDLDAVETEAGVSLLPEIPADQAATAIDPLLLLGNPPDSHALPCGGRALLVQQGASGLDPRPSSGQQYALLWYAQ